MIQLKHGFFVISAIVVGEAWFVNKQVLCELVACLCLTSCFCSLLSIGAISFNRYIHICHNSLYQQIFTLRNGILMCVVLWIISFLAEMPNFFGWGDHVFDDKAQGCFWDRTADYSYTLFFVIVGVCIPVILISICYVLIFLHVRASKRKVRAMNGAELDQAAAAKEKRESMKLVRTLFMIFIVFATCWSPYAILVVVDRWDRFPGEAYMFAALSAHANSSLNFIVYGATNRHFRKGYMQLLGIQHIITKLCPGGVQDTEGSVNGATRVTTVAASTKGSK